MTRKELPMSRSSDNLEPVMKRMGTPSFLILAVLEPNVGLAGTQIIDRAECLLAASGYPTRTLDPATLHYALKRMEDDGLVACQGKQEVDVPGPHGTKRRELRSVYVITGLGSRVLQHKCRLDAAMAERAFAHLKPLLGWEGAF
jgi:DNA-binding PadR family transcriptional regulator